MKKIYFIAVFFFIFSLLYSQKADTSRINFVVDIDLIDLPYSFEHKLKPIWTISPSMHQSLTWSKTIAQSYQYGTKRLFFKPNKTFTYWGYLWRSTSLYTLNAIIEYIMAYSPLGTGWLHEEWHRAVMTHRNVRSFNDMNTFPIGQQTVSVSHVKDNDLNMMKALYNPDFVRLMAAGIEGQYEFVKELQKDNFYYKLDLPSELSYLFNITNSIAYVRMCSKPASDSLTVELERFEGKDVEKQDFTGMDFVAWIYDLSRPDEAYNMRGYSSYGGGIRRYRLTSDLTAEELNYLKQMGNLQLFNLVSPFLVGINYIKINNNLQMNFSMFHYLTSFGYDLGSNFFVKYKKHNILFAYHNYHNFKTNFYGLEAQYIDYEFKTKNFTYFINSKLNIWTQPKNQDFRTNKHQPGFRIEIYFGTKTNTFIEPYIIFSAKTKGWVASDVYLDKNISIKIGIRGRIK